MEPWKASSRFRWLSPEQIQMAPAYRYRFEPALEENHALFAELGVLQPLIVVQQQDRYLLLDGMLRLTQAAQCQQKQLPVQVFAATHLARAFLAGLVLNLWPRGLSVAEKARALQIAHHQFDQTIQDSVRRLLEIPPAGRVPQLLAKVVQLPQEAQRWLHQVDASFRQTERLLSTRVLESTLWLQVAKRLQFKAQEMVSLAEQLWEIALRESLSLEQLYQQLEVEQLLESGWTLAQKQQELKKRIHNRRFPLLKQIQQQVQKAVENLPAEAKRWLEVQWDPTLERTGVGLRSWIQQVEDLDRLIDLLEQPRFREAIKETLKKIQQIG